MLRHDQLGKIELMRLKTTPFDEENKTTNY